MTTHELLEMASLDAMGLLDADEREAFERAFRAAAPAVQAQIRREQLRLSRMDDLLPQVEPPLGLRARVMNAVREAISTMSVRPITSASAAPALRPVGGVHRFWRAFSIGSAAAAIVFGYAALQFRGEYQTTTDALSANAINDHLLKEYGAGFDRLFFDHASRMFGFIAPDGKPTTAKATVLVHAASGRGMLFVRDLPLPAGEYELAAVDRDGRSTVISLFRPGIAGVKPQALENVALENAVQLVIRRVSDGETVLVAQIA